MDTKLSEANKTSKKIEDYMHLYMGCPLSDGLKLDHYRFLYGNLKKFQSGNVKLILRPLSDMNRTDASKMRFAYPMPNDYSYSNEVWSPDQLKYALDHFYDVFGLIDAGLAISSLDLKGGSDE